MVGGKLFKAGVEFFIQAKGLWKESRRSVQALRGVSAEMRAVGEAGPKNFKRITSGTRDLSVALLNLQKLVRGGSKSIKASTSSAASSVKNTAKGVRSSSDMMGAGFVLANQQVRNFGANVMNAGFRGLEVMNRLTNKVISLGGEFEESRIIFKSVFGDKSAEEFNRALTAAEETSLSTVQILQQVPNFGRQGVDVMKKFAFALKDGTEATESGLQLINDLIAGTGQASDIVFQNFNKAIAGSNRNFRALFDGREKMISESTGRTFADMFKMADTAQERSEVIFTSIIEQGLGGLSFATGKTFKFISANLEDILSNIAGLVGERAIAKFIEPLFELGVVLGKLKEEKQFLDALGSAFEQVGKKIAFGIKVAIWFIDQVKNVSREAPILIKFAFIFANLIPVLLIVGGALVLIAGTLGALATFILPALIAGVKILAVVIAVSILPLIAMGAAVVAAYLAFKFNFLGVKDIVGKVGVALKGLSEIIFNYSDGISFMSQETKASLEEAGILEWVLEVGGYIGSLKQVAIDLGTFLYNNFARIPMAFKPAFSGLEVLAKSVIQVVKEVFGVFFTSSRKKLDGSRRNIDRFKAGFNSVVKALTVGSKIASEFFKDLAKSIDENKPTIVGFARGIKIIGKFLKEFLIASWHAFVKILKSDALTSAFRALNDIRLAMADLWSVGIDVLGLFGDVILLVDDLAGGPLQDMFSGGAEDVTSLDKALKGIHVALKIVRIILGEVKKDFTVWRIETTGKIRGVIKVINILRAKWRVWNAMIKVSGQVMATAFKTHVIPVLTTVSNLVGNISDKISTVTGKLGEIGGLADSSPLLNRLFGGSEEGAITPPPKQAEGEASITPAAGPSKGGKVEATLREGKALLDATERQARASEELRDLIASGEGGFRASPAGTSGFGQVGESA